MVVEATAVVVTKKVAVVLPAFTMTFVGTVAYILLLAKPTVRPPVGAGTLKVTVPVDPPPPVTLEGLSDTDDNVATGVITSEAV